MEREEQIGECYVKVVMALFKCQEGCSSEDIWHSVLQHSSVKSNEFCAALQGLAEADVSATDAHLYRLLKRLGRKDLDGEEKTDITNTLKLFLGRSGAPQVFCETLNDDVRFYLPPQRRERLGVIFRECLSDLPHQVDDQNSILFRRIKSALSSVL